MKRAGWEMQPLGWILLIIVVFVSYYLIARWIRRPLPVTDNKV